MADELRISERPDLRHPVLVTAFRGWNDGGQGASLAAGYLAKVWQASRFADIDPEEFYDFQVARPHVSLVEGVTRRLDWPDNAFYHAAIPGLERDAVLLLGIEPNTRWRRFTQLIVGLSEELGIELVVSLGSLLADVPHTRPSPVTGSATDEKLIEQYGLQGSRYEGPTGIVGVLHDACRRAGLASVSLWAAVPHYVSLAPSPRAVPAPRGAPRRFGRRRRARAGGRELQRAGQRGILRRSRHGRVRRAARAARRRARPRVRHPVGRHDCRRADALPPRARAGRRRPRGPERSV